ncbi:hypothetical protein VIBRN418_00906 [Vibrio sp. N418]|nr:hypothetical protein VIBRN418_00906 [Vibrio sp. N418]
MILRGKYTINNSKLENGKQRDVEHGKAGKALTSGGYKCWCMFVANRSKNNEQA